MSYSDYEEESDVEVQEEEEEAPEDQTMKNLVAYCKYGNLRRVKEVLEESGYEYVQKYDLEGHTLVHWAALGGYTETVDFLVEKGAPLNNHSKNDYGPLPIHWACVHGHILMVEYFLEKGVDLDATDLNGCTPLIVAAQYGESLCVSYLLQKGANKFQVDINGDSALHWASFKGNPEIVFLLLNAGLNASQKDSFSQTPLHSACIKGDIQCAKMLIEHGASVDDIDNNGKTPRMLAVGRRNRMLIRFLDNKDTALVWDWRTLVFGPPSRNRYGLIFFLCGMFIWAYPFYFLKVIPITLEDHHNAHLVFWIFTIFQWVLFVWCKYIDPGYVEKNKQRYDETVKMIGNPTAWGDYMDYNNPIFNICHTCKTIRPIRSKHCRYCNRCVRDFDHHCMWLDKCIGVNNRVPFTIFLLVLGVNSLFTIFFLWEVVRITGTDIFVIFGTILFSIFFISGTFQTMLLFQMVVKNMTINERANYSRYRHFKTIDGKFHNPFDRGVVKNCLEYWHLLEPIRISRTKRQSHIV